MAEDIHPGSFVGDSIEEFKKLPTWGKIAIGGIAVLVIYLGIRAYMSKGTSSTSSVASGSLQPTTSAAGSQSPFPSITSGDTSVPLLPSGTNPVYDPQGNLVGYQPGSTPPSQVGATPNAPAQDPFSNFFGLLGANAKVNLSNDTYVNPQGQSTALPIPTTDKLTQGSDNRVWYSDSGGQHLLTAGTGPAIDPRTNTPYVAPSTGQGSGGESWQSKARRPKTYTPQYGDNMNEVANKLGLKGGWRAFGVDSFEEGKPVNIPG